MARKRDNVKALSKFSVSELEGEVVRRRNASKGWGYVTIPHDEDDDDKRPRVGIVSTEYWLKEKCLDDRSLGKSVILPEGFSEAQESEYVYLEGTLEDAKVALNNAGFTYFGEWE